jgi:hypothetical protein
MSRCFPTTLVRPRELGLLVLLGCFSLPGQSGQVAGRVEPSTGWNGNSLIATDQSGKTATISVDVNGQYQTSLNPGIYTITGRHGGETWSAKILVRQQPETGRSIVLQRQ